VLCGSVSTAWAQAYDCGPHQAASDRESEARKLFDEALRLEQSQPQRALELLGCARSLADRPAVSLRIGTIAEKLGLLEQAIEGYERYLTLAGDLAPDRAPIQKRIDTLRDELEEREARADPTLGVTPTTREKPAKSAVPGYIVTGAGTALMLVGGVFLYSAKRQNDDVHDVEPGTTYWNSENGKEKLESARRAQTIGLVSLGVGAIVTGVGVYLVLDARRSVSAGARVGTSSAQSWVRLAF
jgi:hypothetical protein